jgi:hypothetical protein
MAMTRDCLEGGADFRPLGLLGAVCEAFAAVAAEDEADRAFLDFGMEILRSVQRHYRRTTEAPPWAQARRGRISERLQRPKLATVPLQSRPNASPFCAICEST